MSINRLGLSCEPQVPASIFGALDRLDLSDNVAVILYIKSAYNAIRQQGYQEGGDRRLLNKLVTAEEKNGKPLTRKKISCMQYALDIFERHETILSLREHKNICFLVSAYNTVAAGFLDAREADMQLNALFNATMEVCKLYSYNDIGYLKFFSVSLSRYASDICVSTTSTVDEKKRRLIELAHNMKMLKLLVDKIHNMEPEKGSSPQSPKGVMFGRLQEAILLCVSEAVKGIPAPEKWFYFLWERVGQLSKQFVSSKAKNDTAYFSLKLNDAINKGILNDKLLKPFAEQCAKIAAVKFQNYS